MQQDLVSIDEQRRASMTCVAPSGVGSLRITLAHGKGDHVPDHVQSAAWLLADEFWAFHRDTAQLWNIDRGEVDYVDRWED